MATIVSAAIFDLDRTLVRGATTPVFQERLRAAGVVDAPNVLFADLLSSTYALVRENPLTMWVWICLPPAPGTASASRISEAARRVS